MEFLPLVVIALLFWFLVIQPARRRNRQQSAVWEALEPGQEVLTAGGVFGEVRSVDGNEVQLEIAPETVVRVDKRFISGRVETRAEATDPG